MDLATAVAATAPAASPPTGPAAGPVHLTAIVTGLEGALVQVRASPTAAWTHPPMGLVLREEAEIRTGPKRSIRFLIPADEAFCLDSQGGRSRSAKRWST